eukprot:2323471-Pleurochrysis_carterae.AAC.1
MAHGCCAAQLSSLRPRRSHLMTRQARQSGLRYTPFLSARRPPFMSVRLDNQMRAAPSMRLPAYNRSCYMQFDSYVTAAPLTLYITVATHIQTTYMASGATPCQIASFYVPPRLRSTSRSQRNFNPRPLRALRFLVRRHKSAFACELLLCAMLHRWLELRLPVRQHSPRVFTRATLSRAAM